MKILHLMALLRFVASIRNMNNRLNLPQRRYINNTLKVYDITTGINANRNKSEKSYYNITRYANSNGAVLPIATNRDKIVHREI